MFGSFRLRRLLPLGTLVLVMLLGGCVYPAYPGYGYYNGGYYGGVRIMAVAWALSRSMAAGTATAAGVTAAGSVARRADGFRCVQPIERRTQPHSPACSSRRIALAQA